MLAIRLNAEFEEKFSRYCRRKGLTKTAAVKLALERQMAGDVRHPLDLIEELTRGLPSGDPGSSENVSVRIKRKLRAKHNR